MLACFKMCGILLCNHEWLKMSVSTWIGIGPNCFMRKFDVIPGSVVGEIFRALTCECR